MEYSFETNGRFGKKENGDIVEILYYTEVEEGDDEPQELYYKDDCSDLIFGFLHEFVAFDIHESFLEGRPLTFGDMVQLKDIEVSRFLTMDTDVKESYDLYFGNPGLITQVTEDLQTVSIAFQRDVIEMPIYLVERLFVGDFK